MQTHDALVSYLLLLFIAIVVSLAVRRIKLPYSIGLVVAGFVLGYSQIVPSFTIDPSLIIYIFLPALLFDSSFNANMTNLKQHWKLIFAFAIPGTIVSILIVGAIAHFLIDVPWMSSFLFAALIVPTDTISILSVFKELKVPSKLATLVEGESLFNDGVAIIMFKLILALILAEQYDLIGIDYVSFSFSLAASYTGGFILGAASGYAAGYLMKRVKDPLLEIMITVIVIYGVFLLAEKINVSSIVTVVVTSLMIGDLSRRMTISATTQIALSSFWSFSAFALNSILFLFIGLQLNFAMLWSNLLPILIALIAVNVGRIIFIYPYSNLVNWLNLKKIIIHEDNVPLKWQHVLALGNLKGSLSMALVVSLPDTLVYKDFLTVLTFGVVFFSLIVQGTTLRPILRLFRLQTLSQDQIEFDKRQGMIISAKAVLASLKNDYERGLIHSTVYDSLREQYEFVVENSEQSIARLQVKNPTLADAHLQATYYQMLMLQRSVILNAQTQHILSEDAANELLTNFDQQMATIGWIKKDES
ncbi:sodium:proton antiporter [bacterium]|nr:sodium:proton antiporter [bacterium]